MPLDLTHVLDDVVATGVSAVMLDLRMLPDAGPDMVSVVRKRLDSALAGLDSVSVRLLDPATGGHYFRGVG